MPVNLINEKALNEYLSYIVYHGQELETFAKGEFNSPAYVRQNKDAIVRTMVMQWMKHRLRSYLTEERVETKDFLQPIKQDEENLPGWAEKCLAEGKPVHRFVADKIPAKLNEEISSIGDYLYSAADSYVTKTLDKAEETEGKPRLRIDYLKTSNEWDSYEKALHAARKWHELLAKKAAQKKHDEEIHRKSLAGTKSVMKFDGGMEIVQLTTVEALDFESEYMGHCVGDNSFDNGLNRNLLTIYSLRDKKGMPHATIEVAYNKKTGRYGVWQCRGRADRVPNEKYRKYIQTFVKANEFVIRGDTAGVGLIRQYDKEAGKVVYYDLYHLPKDFVIEGHLNLRGQGMTELPDLSDVIVEGDFDCSENDLLSLKGSPKKVGGSYFCSFNKLKDLVGASKEVGRKFFCGNNDNLESFDGLPEKVGISFHSGSAIAKQYGLEPTVYDYALVKEAVQRKRSQYIVTQIKKRLNINTTEGPTKLKSAQIKSKPARKKQCYQRVPSTR